MTFATKIAAEQLQLAECYKLYIAKTATTYYFTSYWKDFVFNDGGGSQTYTAIPITRTELSRDIDMSVSDIVVNIPFNDLYIDTEAIERGYLRNATLTLYWVFRDDPTAFATPFTGRAGEVEKDLHSVAITFKNSINMFNRRIPKWDYSESCRHTMYDSVCGLLEATYKVTGTAEAGSDETMIVDSLRTEADAYFDLGIVTMTSGTCDGEQRLVMSYYDVGGAYKVIKVLEEFPDTIDAGDTYEMIPHCKKNYDSCMSDYLNQVKFGGFQDIPDQKETIV